MNKYSILTYFCILIFLSHNSEPRLRGRKRGLVGNTYTILGVTCSVILGISFKSFFTCRMQDWS